VTVRIIRTRGQVEVVLVERNHRLRPWRVRLSPAPQMRLPRVRPGNAGVQGVLNRCMQSGHGRYVGRGPSPSASGLRSHLGRVQRHARCLRRGHARRNRLRLSGLGAIIGSMSRAGQRDSSFENVHGLTPQKRPNNWLLPAQDVPADDLTGFLGGGP